MNRQEFKQQLTCITPEPSAHFHKCMTITLERIVSEEAHRKESTKKALRTAGRYSSRALALAAGLAVLLCAAALAAVHWHMFDALSFMTGQGTTKYADPLMQASLFQETIHNVEITIREAGYDGRTLLMQYSYRMLDVDEPLGITAKATWGDHLPDGVTEETIVEGLPDDALELLHAHQVGWNFDQLWINGRGLDIPDNSGGVYQGSHIPGEIIVTEYWRLDNEEVEISGPTEITLPIGSLLTPEERKALFDREKGMYNLPEHGVLTFCYDAKDILSQVRTMTPDTAAVLPFVTARVREVAFSPLMTYITLDLQVNPDAMDAFIQENGESYRDEQGNLLWTCSGMDVFGDWISKLELVDGQGLPLFPGHSGQNGYSSSWAEFLYPYIEYIPDELYLAPVMDGHSDMTQAVPIHTVDLP